MHCDCISFHTTHHGGQLRVQCSRIAVLWWSRRAHHPPARITVSGPSSVFCEPRAHGWVQKFLICPISGPQFQPGVQFVEVPEK